MVRSFDYDSNYGGADDFDADVAETLRGDGIDTIIHGDSTFTFRSYCDSMSAYRSEQRRMELHGIIASLSKEALEMLDVVFGAPAEFFEFLSSNSYLRRSDYGDVAIMRYLSHCGFKIRKINKVFAEIRNALKDF